MRDMNGRTVLVSGGGPGIGAATVRAFHAAGARVVITDVLDREGAALATELGTDAAYLHPDVTDEDGWAAALEPALDRFGGLDVLVNNAGIVEFGAIDEQQPKAFRHVLDVNLYGPWLGMHTTAPELRRTKGVVINISLTAGLKGYANLSAYVASKWGLRGLTKSAALELAPPGCGCARSTPGRSARP